MRETGIDGLVCALPSNVLMLTGYWPIVGASIAIVSADGELTLLAPEDEREIYESISVDRIVALASGSLDRTTNLREDISGELRNAIGKAGLTGKRIGIERDATSEQSSYVAMNLYQDALADILAFENLVSADELLWRERAVLTTMETERLRLACAIAGQAYAAGRSYVLPGLSELEIAQYFQTPLTIFQIASNTVRRADGRVAVMSGKRSGNAYGAYALSTAASVEQGELVLTHCNSQADGYWTDITRTYHIAEPDERTRSMYAAMLEAREAAMALVRPGASAADVDRAARDVIRTSGFGDRYKHGTGHGVGFRAIDHRACPRLRPGSPDVLEVGMVFNIEPGIYFEDFGGMRHCDMVLVTETGYELLTPFHSRMEDLVL